MFPAVDITEESQDVTKMGESFLFDFEKGDFVTVDGKLIKTNGIDAIKVWIDKVLRTEKFKFKVYETGEQSEYGVSLMDFINSDYPLDFIKIEIQREVKEALMRNVEILSVNSFSFMREKRTLVCTFTANTIYGEVERKVRV